MTEREPVPVHTDVRSWLSRLAQFAIPMCFVMVCAGRPSDYAGRTIRSVQYVPPDVLAPTDLERVKVLKTGNTLRNDDVAEAIDRLFATGLFDDISVDAQASGDGVDLRVVTRPAKFISGVQRDRERQPAPEPR